MSISDKLVKHCQKASFKGEDEVLWEKFKEGDKPAFSTIYHLHFQTLYFYGLKISGNTALTEDCIQDLFIYLWNNKENLGETNNIKYYLFKSLRRKILLDLSTNEKNKLRQNNAFHQTEAELSHEHILISHETKFEEKEMVTQAVHALTKRQQEAIKLKFYDNLSFKEVAVSMSLNIKSTYNLISKALEVLRGQLHSLPIFLLLSFLF